MRSPMLAPVAILCAAVGAGGCSLVLDFSDRQDAGGGNPRCETAEPNDVADNAPLLAQGTNELALCGNDVDFFTVEVIADQDVILVTTSDDSINLELALLMGGNALQISDGPGAEEAIERSEAMANRLDPGTYTVRVQTVPAGQEGDYDLVLMTDVDMPPDAGIDGS